jgi:formamidopyrimidine-DNA glycosylase
MFRIILLLILLYFLYRIAKGVWKIFSTLSKAKKAGRYQGSSTPVMDQMVPCAHCGTYVPSKIAVSQKGLYFCDRRCQKAHQRESE